MMVFARDLAPALHPPQAAEWAGVSAARNISLCRKCHWSCWSQKTSCPSLSSPPKHRAWPRSCPLLDPLQWSCPTVTLLLWRICVLYQDSINHPSLKDTGSGTFSPETPPFLQKAHRTLEETQGLHQVMSQKISLDRGKAQVLLFQSGGRESTQHWKLQESCESTELCNTQNIF